MKTVIAVLALGCAGLGMSLGAGQDKGNSPTPDPPVNAAAAAEKPVKADPVVFWGKEVDGLQAGLSLVEVKTEQAGDTTKIAVKMDVKIRNVGKVPVTIAYGSPWERSPTITDAAGKEVPIRASDFWVAPILLPFDRVIEPGKTFSLSRPEIILEVDAGQPPPKYITERTVRVRQGAYTISYDWVADSHKKLATGGLPFKVMDPDKAAKADLEADKVAWGKEVGGLQAGLVLKDAHAYRYGDTIKLEVRIRNVGNEKVTITHGLLRECPPEVTGPRDARMTVAMPPPLDFYAAPTYRVLKPGETTTLYNAAVEVQSTDRLTPDGELRVDTPTTYVQPGKYKVAYAGMIQSHPKLATGEVPFNVNPEKETKADLENGRVDDEVVWGKEANGLQAGLSVSNRSGIPIGGKATAVVSLRNLSKQTITTSAWPLWVTGPRVADSLGRRVRATAPPTPDFEIAPTKLTLKPGQAVVVAKTNIFVVDAEAVDPPFPEGVVDRFTIHVRPGAYRAEFSGFLREYPALTTGTVAFQVKEPKEAQRPDDGPRATVERYVAAALAGKVDEAVRLAVQGASPQSPAKRERIVEFAERLDMKVVRFPTAHAAADEALVVSEEVKLSKAEPDGTNKGYLVFTAVKSGGAWLVRDIDFTNVDGVVTRVWKFEKKYPDARRVSTIAPDDPKAGSENKLIGTWKLVSAKYDGEAVTFPDGFTTVKHVTPTQFMWASYGKDGKVVRAAGGSYSLKGDAYQETPEYGAGKDFDGIKGKVQTFEWKVEGNRWHHTGKLDNGPTIDEVWERVEKK